MVSVLKVGLLGMGMSLQKDLNRIAEVADTSTPEGLSNVLTDLYLLLELRRWMKTDEERQAAASQTFVELNALFFKALVCMKL
ncbi:unnamed protein product [Rhodiola kirilowii]